MRLVAPSGRDCHNHCDVRLDRFRLQYVSVAPGNPERGGVRDCHDPGFAYPFQHRSHHLPAEHPDPPLGLFPIGKEVYRLQFVVGGCHFHQHAMDPGERDL